MKTKEVKIIGLQILQQVGILKACNLTFDDNNRLIVVKGGVGDGKTTLQKSLQLGTQGSKTLVDKKLYGDINTEVQLLDGEINIWVGCKSDKHGALTYVLYTKDSEGKIVKDPIIDGVKATPAKYLEMLQTELTWRINELTSENPTVQKKILLSLYQYELQKQGVIFDIKDPGYKESILGKIETAENKRNQWDATRKQFGGIAEDLKLQGIFPDRPDTVPDFIDLEKIEQNIKSVEKEKTTKEIEAKTAKEKELQEIKTEAAELTTKCISYNAKLEQEFSKIVQGYNNEIENGKQINELTIDITTEINKLINLGGISQENGSSLISALSDSLIITEDPVKPLEPLYIEINEENKVTNVSASAYSGEAQQLIQKILDLRQRYSDVESEEVKLDLTKFDKKLLELEESKNQAIENNKTVKAVDSFHEWRNANEEVISLKKKYVKMLSEINTGVDGLKIVPEENDSGKLDIFLMYNGKFDPAYFGNEDLEFRKLSAYSGTQKPVVCLLIQNYLLSKKPKAMRYMYIDNIPIDLKTRLLLSDMCEKLDLRIFLNITGDFDKNAIENGEILIEGGEVFFNK